MLTVKIIVAFSWLLLMSLALCWTLYFDIILYSHYNTGKYITTVYDK